MRLPSESELKRSDSDTRAVGRIVAERPTWDSLASEFKGAIRITDHEDGTRTARIEDRTTDKRHLRRLRDMGRKSKALEAELGQEVHSRYAAVPLRLPDGSVEHARVVVAERAARKRGLRPVIRWGRPSQPDERGLWRNGHTHLAAEPLPWVRERCPGCCRG